MIKQSFLNFLKGLRIDLAVDLVENAGYTHYVVPENVKAISLQSRPNTIVLWQENNNVRTATAGDGLELDSLN